MATIKINRTFFANTSIIFALFIPGHLFEWTVEWLWLGFQVLAFFILFLILKVRPKPIIGLHPKYWIFCFLFYTLIGLLGSIYAYLVLGLQFDNKDLQDHLRFLIYISLALFIGSSFNYNNVDFFTGAIKITVLFNLATSAILLLNVPILFDVVLSIYSDAKVQFDFSHIRIGIPFANPNFAALFFLFAFSYFISFKPSPTFALLSLCSLLMTGSRSGLISFIPLLLISYLLMVKKSTINTKVFIFFVAFHILIFFTLNVLLDKLNLLPRFLELTEALNSGGINEVQTASIRIDVVNEAIKFIELSPIFGIGPGRYYGLDVTDSQLIAWPLMYGIPTSLFIICFFAYLFLKIRVVGMNINYTIGSIAILFAFFLMLSVGDFMKNYRLFFITIMFLHVMRLISSRKSI